MSYELLKPNEEMEALYLDFIAEWEASGEEMVPHAAGLRGMSYAAWLEHAREKETTEAACPAGLVPATTLVLVQDGRRILGAVNIRHRLNDYLLRCGGHIGYGVRPSARRQGHAARMLAMALPVARSLGIDRALVTCDKSNLGSAATIRKNGGVLENEVLEGSEPVQRYWIDLAQRA